MNPGNSPPLAGQAALVSGGARRVGAEIVRHLHAAGASVAIHCHHSLAEAEALAASLESQRPGSTLVVQADLLEVDALPALVAQVTARFGGLQLLVNNASSFYPTPFGTITPSAWADLMGTNLKAPLFLTQAAAPALRERGGLVVNIVDIHGMRPLPDYVVYSTAKAGLIHLTRALARELAPTVRVNAVAPGPVMWPEAGLDEARQAEIIGRTLLGRAGDPTDIARAVRYFAADAPYVTGQVLAVDGGRSVR
jgi:pteridine reductase